MVTKKVPTARRKRSLAAPTSRNGQPSPRKGTSRSVSPLTGVAPIIAPLSFTPSPGHPGAPITCTITVSNLALVTTPVTFTLISGPANCSVDSTTGILTFTPSVDQVGVFPVVVQATSADGLSGISPAGTSITVENNAPTLTVM